MALLDEPSGSLLGFVPEGVALLHERDVEVNRVVYINGLVEGIDRPGVNGGDLLLIPTGLTPGQSYDTWLVKGVPEGWDSPGWTKCYAVLQQPGAPAQ